MRIALVCPYSLSRPGGVQGQVIGLAAALRAAGHETTVVAPVDPDGAGVHEFEGVFGVGSSVSVRANGSVAPLALSPAAIARTSAFVRRGGIDVYHVHEPLAPAINYAVLAWADVPVVGTFHRCGRDALYRALRPVMRLVASRLDVRCAVSEAARDTAAGVVGGTYRILFNGTDLSRFDAAVPAPTDRPTIAFVGRHEQRKGLEVLLEAFSGVPDPAVLWIVSEGPATESLQRRYPPSARLRWLGRRSDDEVASILRGAHVLCVPSLGGESFGVVLLEGMAAGCVVVASDLSAYRRTAGGHAHFVPPGDVEALRRTLTEVLPAAARRAENDPWRRAARAHAEQWSMERLAERYIEVYEQAIGGERRRGRQGEKTGDGQGFVRWPRALWGNRGGLANGASRGPRASLR